MQLHDERIDLLIACLKFSNSHEELATLRGTLMAEPEMLDCLLRTSDRRFMNAALVDGLETKGILHAAPPKSGKPMSTRTRLGQIRQIHEERRSAQTSALKAILRELNDQGIEPLLVKGAVSLLTGKPSWRFQRDLDFAIHPDEVERTSDVLKRLGFRILKEMGQSHHHLDSMFHDDLGVAVEPHLRINGPRAARAVRGLPMMSSAIHAEVDGYKVRMLRPEYALLHGLVHHHFENRGGIYGLIGLKGLLEFAYALETLDEETMAELNITNPGWFSSAMKLRALARQRLFCGYSRCSVRAGISNVSRSSMKVARD